MNLLFSSGSMVYTGSQFSGVYGIQCHETGKWYVGESITVPRRQKAYLGMWCNGQHLILNALKKYGTGSFSSYILERCDIEHLDDREVYWGKELNSLRPTGYNLSLGGKHGARVFTDKHRKNISKSKIGKPAPNRGKKQRPDSIETRMRKSLSAMGNVPENKGKPITEEHRSKLVAAWNKRTPEELKRLSVVYSNRNRLTNLIKWLEKKAPWFCETNG